MEDIIRVLSGLWASVQVQPVSAVMTLLALLLATLFVTRTLLSRVPGPRLCMPIVGETLSFLSDPAAYFMQGYLRYGGVYRTNLLGRQLYCVLEPSAVREVLRGEGTTFSVPFGSFNKLLDDWDHMVDGPLHDYWRKAVSLALSPQAIERYLPALEQTIKKALAAWADQGAVSLMDVSADLALDLALDVLVGVRIQFTDRHWIKAQLLQYLAGLYSLPLPFPGTAFSKAQVAKKNLKAALVKELQAQVSALQQEEPSASEMADASAVLRQLDGAQKAERLASDPVFHLNPEALSNSLGRLKARDAAHTPNTKQGLLQPDATTTRGAATVGVSLADAQIEVLRCQRRLTPSSAADRMLGLFIAATDTTRYAIFTVMAILEKLPEEVEKLRQEQQEVLAKHGVHLTPAALADMQYLDAVVRESNRLLPPSRVGIRQATHTLCLHGVRIPKGAYLLFSVDCQHCLEPTLWQGAKSVQPSRQVPSYMDWKLNLNEAFQPARWLRDNVPKHMMAFGGGAHKCVGMNLVYAESKLFLSLLIRSYTWIFQDPSMLRTCETSPGIRPALGTDTLHIARR